MSKRPSPAMVVAMVALCFAVVGTAVAQDPVAKITKSKVKKIANKQIDKAESGLSVAKAVEADKAKTADSATTAATATKATSADAAVNSALLDGKSAGQLESKVFNASSTIGAIPASATTAVETLSLPAGTYLITARGEINNNDNALSNQQVDCSLVAGGTAIDLGRNLVLGAAGTAGEAEVASANLTHTFAAPGDAVIECVSLAGWVGNMLDPAISAISAQP